MAIGRLRRIGFVKLLRRVERKPAEDDEQFALNWDAAKLSISEFGNWIKNADSKVTLLGAAFSVSVSVVATKADVYRSALVNDKHSLNWLLVVLLTLTVVALLSCAVCIYVSLVPRTKAGVQNLFSWASVSSNEVIPAWTTRQKLLDDAWVQCIDLASIARTKYFWFKRALISFGFFILGSALTFILALIGMGVA